MSLFPFVFCRSLHSLVQVFENWQLLNESTLALKFGLDLSHQAHEMVFSNLLKFHLGPPLCVYVLEGGQKGQNWGPISLFNLSAYFGLFFIKFENAF